MERKKSFLLVRKLSLMDCLQAEAIACHDNANGQTWWWPTATETARWIDRLVARSTGHTRPFVTKCQRKPLLPAIHLWRQSFPECMMKLFIVAGKTAVKIALWSEGSSLLTVQQSLNWNYCEDILSTRTGRNFSWISKKKMFQSVLSVFLMASITFPLRPGQR